jgi:translation initiation factor 1 (eIF-1/SUI1)
MRAKLSVSPASGCPGGCEMPRSDATATNSPVSSQCATPELVPTNTARGTVPAAKVATQRGRGARIGGDDDLRRVSAVKRPRVDPGALVSRVRLRLGYVGAWPNARQRSRPAPNAAPFHSPFAASRRAAGCTARPGRDAQCRTCRRPAASGRQRQACPGLGKLVLQREKKGRGGKTVTRVRGLPPASELDRWATDMKRALGCGASVEDGEVILLGDLVTRAADWLAGAAALVTGGARQLTHAHRVRLAEGARATSSPSPNGAHPCVEGVDEEDVRPPATPPRPRAGPHARCRPSCRRP